MRVELRAALHLCDEIFRIIKSHVPSHRALDEAWAALCDLRTAAERGRDHVKAVRGANLLTIHWMTPKGGPPHDRAVFFLARLLREAALLVSKDHANQWSGYIQPTKTAAASALWHLGPGGPGSGRAAADRVEEIWQDGMVTVNTAELVPETSHPYGDGLW